MDTPAAQQVPRLELRGGAQIPQLGFGVFQVPRAATAEAVARALQAGYRHIDTAAAYGNEAEVGRAVRDSGVPRDQVFVTTKCSNDDHGYDQARQALHASLERLGLDYVDLYLIHWPIPWQDLYVETWRAFIDLRDAGLTHAIGVSNFNPPHLQRLIGETAETPEINQVELHPYLQQPQLREVHAELGVVTEAWSPIAQGAVLDDPVVTQLAEAHAKTPAQIVIRWHLQLGNVVIPKSATPRRIEQNFAVFDFELSDEDMSAIEWLDRDERTGPDPDTFPRP